MRKQDMDTAIEGAFAVWLMVQAAFAALMALRDRAVRRRLVRESRVDRAPVPDDRDSIKMFKRSAI